MLVSSLISLVLWFLSTSFFLAACLLYILFTLVISPPRLQPLVRLVCHVTLLLAGQRLEVEGEFPSVEEGPYLYIFNHTSLFDVFILIGLIPEFTGAVGKKEQFDIPIWGAALRRWGVVGIERSNVEQAVRSLELVEKAVSGGLSLLVSPEGTRSDDGSLGAFKKGPFHVALNTSTPLVPILIQGAFEAKNTSSWRIRPSRIRVRIESPIVPGMDGEEDVDSLRLRTHRRVEEGLAAMGEG